MKPRGAVVRGQITERILTLNETGATSPRVSKLPAKGKIVNIFFAFADHTVSLATTQLHNRSKKAAQTTHQ